MGGEKRFIHPPKAAFIAVLYCMHGQRDEKGLNLSPKRKNKFISVITKPSLNHDEVETSHRLYTHQKIMNKKAGTEKNHLVLDSGCVWGVTK